MSVRLVGWWEAQPLWGLPSIGLGVGVFPAETGTRLAREEVWARPRGWRALEVENKHVRGPWQVLCWT